MWEQLGFRAEPRISGKQTQIRLTDVEATPIDKTLPTILPTSRIHEVEISLQYRAKDNVVTGNYLAPVTHAALLKFWGDKIASVAPTVGRVGYVRRLEKIETPVSRIMQALQTHSCRGRGRKAHLARVAPQTTARTTPRAELSPSTAAGHTLAEPLPGTAGVTTGSAAWGQRLVVLRHEKRPQTRTCVGPRDRRRPSR